MPLLDIAISHPCSCFRNNILAFSSESRFHSKLVIDNDRRLASAFSWKTYCVPEKVGKNVYSGKIKVCRGGLIIKAIATLEITSLACKNEEVNRYKNVLRMDIDSVKSNSHVCEPQSSSEDSTVVDEREKLRRDRISKANKGNTPWNKGRKHSPETLQRIKERTRIAMQDPKVKMKLVNLGHAQSDETRMKIGVGVRLGWERRREKLMLQETCYYEWQNLIAVASRKGLLGEEELQWDSYKILNKQYEQEWFHSVEQRKNTPRSKGNKRAPKSAEQRKKIAAAIAAKWADPEYRNRVCSALAKFHGTAEVAERMPRRKPSGDRQTQKRKSKKKDEINDLAKRETKSQIQRIRLKKSRTPLYKDPFASFKLEMLKDMRAQRVAGINKQNEAISRAKLLIAEAEKAAIALEIAAKNSPLVQASLLESRMLISEAMHFIKSIENEDPVPFEMSETTTEPELHVDEEIDADNEYLDDANLRKVNGVQRLSSSDVEAQDFSFNTFDLPALVNGNASNYCHVDLLKTGGKLHETSSNDFLSQQSNDLVNLTSFTKNLAYPKPAPNGTKNLSQTPQSSGLENSIPSEKAEPPQKQVKLTKKWVCGRLVEVAQET